MRVGVGGDGIGTLDGVVARQKKMKRKSWGLCTDRISSSLHFVCIVYMVSEESWCLSDDGTYVLERECRGRFWREKKFGWEWYEEENGCKQATVAFWPRWEVEMRKEKKRGRRRFCMSRNGTKGLRERLKGCKL